MHKMWATYFMTFGSFRKKEGYKNGKGELVLEVSKSIIPYVIRRPLLQKRNHVTYS